MLSVSSIPVFASHVEQLPEGLLLGVLGAGGVAGRGADALVLLGDQVLVVEVLVGHVAPELGADALVQPLGEGLGQPVGERLEQDRGVVVVVLLERLDPVLGARARR